MVSQTYTAQLVHVRAHTFSNDELFFLSSLQNYFSTFLVPGYKYCDWKADTFTTCNPDIPFNYYLGLDSTKVICFFMSHAGFQPPQTPNTLGERHKGLLVLHINEGFLPLPLPNAGDHLERQLRLTFKLYFRLHFEERIKLDRNLISHIIKKMLFEENVF